MFICLSVCVFLYVHYSQKGRMDLSEFIVRRASPKEEVMKFWERYVSYSMYKKSEIYKSPNFTQPFWFT